ncbi:hypothetical protein F511_29987 [Dorcoceras hygrometricum]|uniref:Uncharacterized protein n=1 Tax=Dorcoceras hygrometricum TaxID=472368 RepID=A0A2Z7C4E2_9LAMI|nr:hypothetical protein F511_29987 [Dorcoceras hygrometricum]
MHLVFGCGVKASGSLPHFEHTPWPPFVADLVELCLSSLPPFLVVAFSCYPAGRGADPARGATGGDSIGYPRMSTSGESSTTMHRLLHASGSHPIPTPGDPKEAKKMKLRRAEESADGLALMTSSLTSSQSEDSLSPAVARYQQSTKISAEDEFSRSDKSAAKQLTIYESWMSTAELNSNGENEKGKNTGR